MLDASGITRPGSELTGSASLNRYGARMSLAVAVPCAVLAAITYGASTALQHSAAHRSTGRADPRGLVRLLGNSRWLMSIGGDGVGLLLQVVALATGPVVLVQPIRYLPCQCRCRWRGHWAVLSRGAATTWRARR